MIGSSHLASRHLSDPSSTRQVREIQPKSSFIRRYLLHGRSRSLARSPARPCAEPPTLAARARRIHALAARARLCSYLGVCIVHSPRATAHHNAPARPSILPADPSCPRGRAHSSPAMPAARPASLTPSTPYITPAHRSLVHPDLSTLVRAGSGTLGHLKRTVRSRRRRSPHTGAYASLNEEIAPLSRGSRC